MFPPTMEWSFTCTCLRYLNMRLSSWQQNTFLLNLYSDLCILVVANTAHASSFRHKQRKCILSTAIAVCIFPPKLISPGPYVSPKWCEAFLWLCPLVLIAKCKFRSCSTRTRLLVRSSPPLPLYTYFLACYTR